MPLKRGKSSQSLGANSGGLGMPSVPMMMPQWAGMMPSMPQWPMSAQPHHHGQPPAGSDDEALEQLFDSDPALQ